MSARTALLLLALTLSPSCAQGPPTETPVPKPPPALRPAPAPASATASATSWRHSKDESSEVLAPGVSAHLISLEKPSADGPSPATTLLLVRFNQSGHSFKIVDRGNGTPLRYAGLADAMKQNGCIAGCNGGFFHPDFRPLGLVIADGTRIHKFETANLLSGLLLVDSKGPRILRRAEFKDGPGITQLLQSGPFLVDRGRTVTGLSESPARARTFVATDGKGQWAIGHCSRATLADLGEILDHPTLVSGLDISRALNLDGGTSSSLYFERAEGRKPHLQRSFKTVRNFLGIVPR